MNYSLNSVAHTLTIAANLCNPTLRKEEDQDCTNLMDEQSTEGFKNMWCTAIDMISLSRPDILVHGTRDDCVTEMLKDKDILTYITTTENHPQLALWSLFA